MAKTFLFADTAGIIARWGAEPAGLDRALTRHEDVVGRAVTTGGGRVFRRSGDGLAAVFDDWRAAVRAALAVTDEIGEDAPVRIGLDRGDASSRGDDFVGQVPTRAARLAAVARDGQVLAAPAIGRRVIGLDDVIVHDAGERVLPGLGSQPVHGLERSDRGSPGAHGDEGSLDVVPSAMHRRDEHALLRTTLAEALDGPVVALLEGEAGIGKTTLWRDGLVAARLHGIRVLAAIAPQPGSAVAYGVLRDLLASVSDRELEPLPEPQRRALEVVLVRRDADGHPASWEVVAAGLHTLLAELAARRSVVVAVDDLGWADDDTARVLAHALQRRGGRAISLLATDRTGPGEQPATWARSLEPGPVRRQVLARMDTWDLATILHARVDDGRPLSALERVAARADGHPLLAMELVRTPATIVDDDPTLSDSATGARVRDLVGRRLAGLDAATRSVLETLALAATGELATLRDALGDATDLPAAVVAAQDAGLAVLDGDRLRFAHPLYRQAVVARIDGATRRRLHRRLAEAVEDPVERAHHLARSTVLPSDRVADELADAARLALDRGAPTDAAALARRAYALTDAELVDTRVGRGLLAAGALTGISEFAAAEGLLDELADLPASPSVKARVALAHLRWIEMDATRMLASVDRFLARDDLDPDTITQLHVSRAFALLLGGDLRAAVEEGERAVAAASDATPRVRAAALGQAGQYEDLVGLPTGREKLHEAARLLEQDAATDINPLTAYDDPRVALALSHLYADDLEEARALMRERLDLARSLGQEAAAASIGLHAVEVAVRAGQLDDAVEHLRVMDTLVSEEELAASPGQCYAHTLVAAVAGDADDTAHHSTVGLAAARASNQAMWELGNRWGPGHLALSRGEVATADRHLAPLADLRATIGLAPAVHRVDHDVAEAAILSGDLERAETLVAGLERLAGDVPGGWTAAGAARNRVLLELARGHDVDDVLDRALELATAVPDPHERARTHLVAGMALRRQGARAKARDHLDRAVAVFADHGMPRWAERAEAERDRISGRRPSVDSGLTETETQVADLAAAGLTNREIAARLFLSPKTVEHNLTRIYRKLGIRSRTELAARGVEDPPEVQRRH